MTVVKSYVSDKAKRAYQGHQKVSPFKSQIDQSNLRAFSQKCQNSIEKHRMKERKPLESHDKIVDNISIKNSLHSSLPSQKQQPEISSTSIKSRRKRYLRRRQNRLRVRRRLVRFKNMPADSERVKNKEVMVGKGVRTVYSIHPNHNSDNLPTNRKPMASPELLKLFPHLKH